MSGLTESTAVWSPSRIVGAYTQGYFLGGDPDWGLRWEIVPERSVIWTGMFRVPRRVLAAIRRHRWEFDEDRDFAGIVEACRTVNRPNAVRTWLTERVCQAHVDLFSRGFAGAFELRLDGTLVAGLFGVKIGRVFFSESMFHRADSAGSVVLTLALRRLAERDFALFDAGSVRPWLARYGAQVLSTEQFRRQVADLLRPPEAISLPDLLSPAQFSNGERA